MTKTELSVGPAGFVRLVDTMPGIQQGSLDAAIVQAARISVGAGSKGPDSDTALIRYLMRNRHTSPFEMVEFKFHLKMPIFVARQWMRHRMASINEYSGRYAEIPDECAIPKAGDIRTQSSVNKQSSDLLEFPGNEANVFTDQLQLRYKQAYAAYTQAVKAGIAREQARIILPQSMYTQFYWKIDLHNFLHFTKLRADPHAQQEIQEFAKACYALVKPLIPIAAAAFEDYVLHSLTFSRQEVQVLKQLMSGTKDLESVFSQLNFGKTEQLELRKKLQRIDCDNKF